MKRASPQRRDFAERLISLGAAEATSSAPNPPALFTVIEQLRPSLVQVVGALGFSAVLSRALAIAHVDVAWLRTVPLQPDGLWGNWEVPTADVGADEISEGSVVLLAEFVSLLVDLIGERLVLQLVHQAIPALAKDDLYFEKGSEREKN